MKRNRTATVVALVFLFVALPFQANGATDLAGQQNMDEIVVTATRLQTPWREVGSSIIVITAEQMREQGKTTVIDAIRSVPSLSVAQTGGPGQTASVFMRGAKSEHTLVLIDGVDMNDPSSPGRGFDFSKLTVSNIDRIEILQGPQSTLYGSDAMGGVINIITKKGTGKLLSGAVAFEGGSYRTFTENAWIGGNNELFNYFVDISRMDTDGFSAADKRRGNTERDGYSNTTLSTRVGITPSKNFDADIILRFINVNYDIDNFGGVGGDDPNNKGKTKQLFLRAQSRFSMFDDLWEQKFGFSLSDYDQKFQNGIDADHPSDLDRSTYEGRIVKFDWQHNLHLHETNTLTLGLESKKEKASSTYYEESIWGSFSSDFAEQSARINSFYIQDHIRLWDSWFTTLGARVDDHNRYGTKSTFRAASSYLFRKTSTRIKGSYGTGFKAPSLYQLYSSYGNIDLDPEKSAGWDVGIEQSFFRERLKFGATYFRNDFKSLVDFDSATSRFVNVGEARTRGVEITLFGRPIEDLVLRAGYTYTEAKDSATGEKLLRRPRNKASFGANYRFLSKGNADLEILWVGRRDDSYYNNSTFTASREKLGSYTLVNLAASFDVAKNFKILCRIVNLFDKKYEEVFGYGTPGLSAYGGIRVSF
ncbi:MAG: TonB-dependent receptor [Syntrophorhabdaceae bacterium]|nr:TonB-dependent receptor [Syntrophorhabdaceae bacterium]